MAAKLTVEDVLDLKALSDVEVSRDGRRVAFVVRPTTCEAEQAPQGRIWIADLDPERAPFEATRGPGNDALPRWSPDGSKLAYASDRGHTGLLSLHLLDFTGESRAVGDLNASVEDIHWSSDGSSVLVLAADPGSDRAGAQSATKIRAAGEAPEDPVVRRPAQAWRRIWRIDLGTGEAVEVGPEGVNVWEFGWSGSGPAVAVVTADPSESAWYDAEVALLDLDARTMTKVYDAEWQLQCPVISPDGSQVAFIEGFNSDRAVIAGTITVVDVASGASRTVAPELDVFVLRWLENDRLAYAGPRGLETMCGTVSLDGQVDEAWSGEGTLGMTHRMVAACSADGRIFAAPKEAANEPHELVVLDTTGERAWRTLTGINAKLAGRATSTAEPYSWTAADGLEIQGILIRPADAGDEPLPLVVCVHGGPTNAWTFTFSHGYMNIGLLLAEEGYAVLLPNPRGSSGRGQEFARLNLGDMGGGDLQDILAGIDSLAEAGIVDRARVGVTGGSYGGFMSTWAPTQTDAFAAAVPFAISSNWLSFHNTTNIGRFDALFLQDDPYDPTGEYFKRSPVAHSRSCKTPMLILHGQLDLCCPVSQAHEMYQALVEAGCETELVIYARGGHGWAERGYLVDTWERTKGWFDRYLVEPETAGRRVLETAA
ncbi:MAG TPA: S9 family peptidase [Gaiellaceae bacterium]|jgi:dipeptidyl aminopeptidase/acylaminoacyl peptidase